MTVHPPTTDRPFSAELEHTPVGPGEFRAELTDAWLVGGGKVHGGVMLAVATRAALAGLAGQTGGDLLDPLAVSGEFLRAPVPGPVHIRTEVVKTGRTASVVRATMTQDDRLTLSTTVTAGRLPTDPPVWSDLPELPAEPPPGMTGLTYGADVPPIARSSRILVDPAARNPDGREPEPVLRGWVRPVGEPPDVYFALFAGDALPPVPMNFGMVGWAPTVQLTALLRAAPAPGWLRTEIRSRSIGGGWFDEDATVIDAEGRLVCQARQLALVPQSGS